MVAMDLKVETFKLMDKRTAVETEMNLIIERLSQPGGPGLSGNLVDFEVSKVSNLLDSYESLNCVVSEF